MTTNRGMLRADNVKEPAPPQRPGSRHRRFKLPCTPHLYTLDAMLRDLRHLDAAAYPEFALWQADLKLSGKAATTLEHYGRTGALLCVAYPDTPFAGFTDGHLTMFLLGFPEKSQRGRAEHLKSWFRWGRRTRRLTENPCDFLPAFRRHRPRVTDVFTDAEVAQLEALPLPDGPLMSLLFGAGLRLTEARMMQARRIDFNRRLVIVSEGAKGSRDRVVPMLDELASPLANLLLLDGLNPYDHLWYSRRGGVHRVICRDEPISGTSFGRWWRRSLEDADVAYRNPHTSRHTFAHRWRMRGLDNDRLQKLLGHASISTTVDHYGHLDVEQDIASKMRELVAL